MKEIINRNAKLYADKTAFVFGDKKYTFAQFNQRVNRLIHGMNHLGVGKGDRVGILG